MSQSTRTGCIVIDLLYNLYNLEDIHVKAAYVRMRAIFQDIARFWFRSTLLCQMFQEANTFLQLLVCVTIDMKGNDLKLEMNQLMVFTFSPFPE